ncbi:MAG: metallophosphoesterase [Cyanophyceae cyanobacterium]
MKRSRLIVFAAISLSVLLVLLVLTSRTPPPPPTSSSPMLSAPFLQLPTETSVRVVWFTEFPGSFHRVAYGEDLDQQVGATTTQLTRLREDSSSQLASPPAQPTLRPVWRHEATVSGLTPGQRVPYQVISFPEEAEQGMRSEIYTLAPKPPPGTSLKILLTSDHQQKPMTAANLQKAVETIGRPDAVFMAGDLVNVPDRASEWFDDEQGGAFFPGLQGRANYVLDKNRKVVVYQGGEIIQHAPLFPALGNHEVMGRFSMERGLNDQFNDPFPRKQALIAYEKAVEQINPGADPQLKEAWLKANSFNTDTYEEIFTLPQSKSGGEKYYAVTVGDVRLVALFVTNIWRSPRVDPDVRGRYQEREQDLSNPERWGYGQHIFEPIAAGSPQYRWLQQELASPEFEQAKYKIVMFHHPPHTLGDNVVPPYTDPVHRIDYAEDGSIQSLRYEYPPENDYIIRDLIPLLESAGVQLVYYGHSHLWNRFVSPQGIHFLESSNVGNTYGAYLDKNRPVPQNTNIAYAATGDPNGLEPVVPTEAPLVEAGQPLPYIASNDITVFSILDTEAGTVSSYRFDTREPDSAVVLFDQFSLIDRE